MILAFHLNVVSLHSIAQVSAARIADCLVEGTLVAAFAALVLRVTPRFSSGARFAVWFCALMAMALPLFGLMFGAMFGTMFGTMFGGAGWADGAGASHAVLARPEIMLPGTWASWLFGAWVGIAVIGLARVGVGLWRLRGVRRSCVEVDSKLLDAELQETLARSLPNRGRNPRKARSAALCISDRVSVPTVIGFVSPVVVIPQWLMQELSPSELEQVLLHELAHLQRWDDWTNLAQKVLKAVLFFHPAVWWIEKQLSLEREMACDDAVVAQTANPRAYAECLTRLAEKSFVRRSLALAQAALGRVRQTSLRVAQILDASQPRVTRPNWKPAMLLVAGFSIACASGISRAPRLVGFEDSSPSSTQIAKASSVPSIPSTSSSATSSDQPATAANLRTILHPVKARFQKQQPRAIPAKSSLQNQPQNLEVAHREFFYGESWSVAITNVNAVMSPARASELVYWPHLGEGLQPVTETVFVVIESRGSTAAYRISVWRVVVQQPAGGLNPNTIPHKET